MNRNLKSILLAWSLLLLCFQGRAQDFQFSQFYAAPLYLNPALTGISQETRMGSVYRRQWPGLDYQFTAFTAYIDHYSFDHKSGMGLSVSSFSEEFLKLNTSDISLHYAYNLQLAERVNFQVGTQISFIQKRGTLENLLFGDQIDVFNQALLPSSADAVGGLEPFSYFSVGLGGVLTWDKLWLGFSGHHLNRPNIAFYVRDGQTQHWSKYSLQAGYTLPLEEPEFWEEGSGKFVHFMANYKRQGPFQFLDAGVQVLLNQLVVGAGLRGMPIQSDLPKRESVIGLFGLNLFSGLAVGYSYDYPISDVGVQTLGSHELSLRYQFFYGTPKSRGQRSRVLSCFSYLR
ncbi:MAG: PorP/SprF family type IX secretion system membrane protein [Bacteroidetes bacterium]|nr:PorP/SprF family type IX secretion system membrane protein [Bacteroidota bacterium]